MGKGISIGKGISMGKGFQESNDFGNNINAITVITVQQHMFSKSYIDY